MNSEVVESILEQVRSLPPEERAKLADEIDRLTWRDRRQGVLDRVHDRAMHPDAPDDAEIDNPVDEVRSETPLYERYWIRQRRSAP